VRVKPKPRIVEVERIKGLSSRELSERCPDDRTTFPRRPCTNIDCPWSLQSAVYMNCTFVAAEAVALSPDSESEGLSLEEVGEAMNLTREGVRLIQIKALRKVRQAFTAPAAGAPEDQHEPAVLEPGLAAREGRERAGHHEYDQPYEGDQLPALRRRTMA